MAVGITIYDSKIKLYDFKILHGLHFLTGLDTAVRRALLHPKQLAIRSKSKDILWILFL